MEHNPTLDNSGFNFGKALGSIVAISTIAISGALLVTVDNELLLNPPAFIYGNSQSMYGLLEVKIISDNTGKAIINLDGQRVFITFEFDRVPDYNGALGGDTTAIDIKELKEIRVLDRHGNEVRDNTTFDDHRNMISIITAHVYANRMVEV
ncbi:hypothetical protein F889_01569 [Acinetobacter colistiniresistens]|uniref:Uncharacterized protein n=1 Tax=Acinetobacter colistiniresistens TaxID=280145 RepID=N9PN01_9GAMM|nr:hypothetical protein [Acinetobacter colistiniresistens]ENX34929.1 hypothetical protein F889_01569 [Acinetobacter colistiniresistens]